jgi:hypothetical protein
VVPARVVKPKQRRGTCRPRCKRCPVVCKRLMVQGLAEKQPDGRYVLSIAARGKHFKAAARATR